MTTKEALLRSGKNLRQIRNEKGLSVETLALLTHVDEHIIRDIEDSNFDFPIELIFHLASELNVDFRQILIDPVAYK